MLMKTNISFYEFNSYAGDSTGDLLATLCESVSDGSVFVSVSDLYLVFKSDALHNGLGFKIDFKLMCKYYLWPICLTLSKLW